VDFADPQISPDGQTVGWLAQYPNCCTSYPIPMKLVIYSDGKVRMLTGINPLPIWQWCFEAGGKQVAFEQETTHGHLGVHYELRDVSTGRLIEEYAPKTEEEANLPGPSETAPKWVKELDAVFRATHNLK
jgi:hypothetical protein